VRSSQSSFITVETPVKGGKTTGSSNHIPVSNRLLLYYLTCV
jgi:hypothetical protein